MLNTRRQPEKNGFVIAEVDGAVDV